MSLAVIPPALIDIDLNNCKINKINDFDTIKIPSNEIINLKNQRHLSHKYKSNKRHVTRKKVVYKRL